VSSSGSSLEVGFQRVIGWLRGGGPSDGRCALCGEWETCDHIFFNCHIAKFMWAGIRELGLGNSCTAPGIQQAPRISCP
jgi:hypothetical protein